MNHIKNLRKTEFGLEGEVFFGLFDKFIGLIIEDDSTVEFAEDCAELLNSLDDEVINWLCRASELYCNDFLYQVGEPQLEFQNSRSVLEKVYPGGLIVPPPNENRTPVVWMELRCEWEEEHGMEWVIRNNRVYYVGAYGGSNPYGDFDGNDSWNYAWQVK